MDYSFVLRSVSQQNDKSKPVATIEAFGVKRFAKDFMWIM